MMLPHKNVRTGLFFSTYVQKNVFLIMPPYQNVRTGSIHLYICSGQCLPHDAPPPVCKEWVGENGLPIFMSHQFSKFQPTFDYGISCSNQLDIQEVMVPILGANCVIAKDVKSCSCCCYVRCATHTHSLLGLPDKWLVKSENWDLEHWTFFQINNIPLMYES